MMGNEEENREKDSGQSGLKNLWNAIPPIVKLKIIGVLAGVVLFILILVVLISIIPANFLQFSEGIKDTDDYQSQYEEYWGTFCDENNEACTQDQKEASKKLKESQEKFYNKLDSLFAKSGVKSESSLREQRDIVLATVFYNYSIDEFMEGGAFTFDEDDEIDYNVDVNANVDGQNPYEREQDTLKELIKQFKVNTAFCIKPNLDGGENIKEVLKNSSGEAFSFNYFDNFKFAFGFDPANEGFAEAKAECLQTQGASVQMEVSSESEASIEGYYKYLRESDFLDDRTKNKDTFIDYAEASGLSQDFHSWKEEDKIAVREKIIRDIKDIVETHKTKENEDDKTYIAFGHDYGYWWPIGSAEVINSNGKQYATGTPYSTKITSEFVTRISPITGKTEHHNGLDIAPSGGAPSGVVPIIASKSGVVVYPTARDNIGFNDYDRTKSYGNFVIIQHTDGNYTLYGHMYKNSIIVRAGESVEQGQVIGYMGSSGDSLGVHLHFEVREGANAFSSGVNPRNYVSLEDPRPHGILDEHFITWFEAHFEGSTGTDPTGTMYLVKDIGDGKRTVGAGVTLDAQKDKFAQYGINVDDYPNGSYIPVAIVDAIKQQILDEAASSIQATLSRAGLTFEKEKIEALVMFKYNLGNINGFTDAYLKYGDTEALYDNYFGHYVHVNGEVWPGLVTRRKREWDLFHNHIYYGEEERV